MEAELADLRSVVDGFGYAERSALQAELERLRSEQLHATAERQKLVVELEALRAELIKARDDQVLQEIGIFDYHHVLEDAVAYREQLDQLRAQIKAMAKRDGGAVSATTSWSVNGSAKEGQKMVREFSKLLLRAYNGEADVLVSKLKPARLANAIDRLDKSRSTISKLGRTMSIEITNAYHDARILELRLTADYLAKKEAEKEAEREEKQRLRDEARARKEFEAEKARLLKERSHYETALASIRQTGTPDEIAAAEATLSEIDDAIHGVEDREANIRAGYVYVISNVGAFGPNVVKIGMTRRLEPLDRVRELGDASVPFKYDVHALIFSNDAVGLEQRLHTAFEQQRLNLVNLRREFFYATPAQVRDVLTSQDGSVLEFVEEPEAEEWHQSDNARRAVG